MSTRADRCTACGRPTYAGEDFGGPCVHDTDLACALAQRDEARRATLITVAEMCERKAAEHKTIADDAFARGWDAMGGQHVDRAAEARDIASIIRDMAERGQP